LNTLKHAGNKKYSYTDMNPVKVCA